MNIQELANAVVEAKIFIDRAEKLIARRTGEALGAGLEPTSALSGAVHRSSMELTRALAKARRPESYRGDD